MADTVAFLLPGLIALFAAGLAGVVSIRAMRSVRSEEKVLSVPAAAEADTRRVVRGAQARMLLALATGVVLAILVANLPVGGFGISLVIAPSAGAVFALLVLVASPLPRPRIESGIRRAELTARDAGSFGPRRGFVLPLVSAALLVIFLVTTGISAGGGLYRRITVFGPHSYGSAGPYPGWFYAIPLIIATVILAITMLIALHRIAAARWLGSDAGQGLDTGVRRMMARFVMLLIGATVVFYLGAATLEAGSSLRTAARWNELSTSATRAMGAHAAVAAANGKDWFVTRGDAGVVHHVIQPQYTSGAIGAVVGLVLIAVALTLGVLAVASIHIRWSVSAPSEPAKVDA